MVEYEEGAKLSYVLCLAVKYTVFKAYLQKCLLKWKER